ncbi:hypothetical protein BN7_2455 [Wickerhamomyces ciferrii]|uniref:Uncharacterized protein n=1 Tax=Wickerhamomyces ciferrii (strain ATCC 14091 / BCRC 22168 / CBS 111 / JCM 3599 / NBRC 0793 / NRRL Y-1031 F-60-10) TaxID=1206466 RepID=K0KNE4_WICCF|nr:uncharacterized protein BN7_2455 [Wickerhamomyces ciferrii]CCH42909.1 hypothetical protein BN7_2455 [Wickerhamomyces ciferrii]
MSTQLNDVEEVQEALEAHNGSIVHINFIDEGDTASREQNEYFEKIASKAKSNNFGGYFYKVFLRDVPNVKEYLRVSPLEYQDSYEPFISIFHQTRLIGFAETTDKNKVEELLESLN